jgi:branched-chain amino acid transport system substrate-binding protein
MRSRVATLVAGILAAVCLSIGFAACGDDDSDSGGGASGGGEPIKVGVLQDKSGIVAFSSKKQIQGLKAAVAGINEGENFWAADALGDEKGIDGRKIELVYEDTQANPNQALIATQKLASQGVAAIIGTTSSPEALQARVACEQAKVPCIFPNMADAAIVEPPNNTYAYTMTPTFAVQAEQMAEALKAAGLGNAALVSDDSGTSNVLSETFKQAFEEAGFPIEGNEVIPADAQDVTAQVQRLKGSTPDAVIDLVVAPTLNAQLVKQLERAQVGAELYGINTLADPEIRAQIGEPIDGAVVLERWNPSLEAVKAYADFFHEQIGDEEVISTQVLTASGILALKAAVENAGSTDGEAINAELEKLTDFPVGYGQEGNTVGWTADDHNGAGAASVVFLQYEGLEMVPWKVYQPPVD